MKPLLFILSVLFTSITVAQKDSVQNISHAQASTNNPDYSFNKHKFEIGLGLGFSSLLTLTTIGGSGAGGIRSTVQTILPVGNASVSYGITKRMSLGIAYTYTHATGQFLVYQTQTVNGVSENFSRQTFDFLVKYNVIMNENGAFYFGAGAGYAYWTDMLVYADSQTKSTSAITTPTLGAPFLLNRNGQVFCGIKTYNAPIQLFAEVSIGIYLLKIGLNYVF